MNIKLNIKREVFNEKYFPYLFDYTNKIEVYYGGSGSGKSFFISQKLLIKALKQKRKILVIRKTQVSQKESCWRLFQELLGNWKILEYCNMNKSEMTVELPNGSIFLFKGLDDPEKIKSIVGITDIWCEECTELTEEDFDQLRLRMRAQVDDLQVYASFNPISKANWVFKRWFGEDKEVTNTLVLKTTYKDNKFLPADYVSTLEGMINTNPTYYKIYALGEFCSLDKLVYNNWRIGTEEEKGELLVGLDFGYTNDPTALIVSILNEEKKTIYIKQEWVATNKTNKEIAQAIKALGLSKSTIIADSAEPKSVEEIKREGVSRIRESVKGADSIIHGIQKIQQYTIIVNPQCEHTITELENYSWEKDKKSGEYTNKPIDQFNHCLDSLRYSYQCVSNKLKTISKRSFGL